MVSVGNPEQSGRSMASRHEDWFRQGERDLAHARNALEDGDHEWACFAAQQGAEKAVKAVFQKLGGDAWGHSVAALLEALPRRNSGQSPHLDETLLDAAKELDKHYIPARYPNAHPQGAPYESYTQGEAERAISNGERIIQYCSGVLAGPVGNDREAPEVGGEDGTTVP